MYEPLAELLLDHARKIGEPADLLARARLALRQPGDSAPHNDHFHVRIYCSEADRAYGCIDRGPMELLAEEEARKETWLAQVTDVLTHTAPEAQAQSPSSPALVTPATVAATPSDAALRSLLRTRADRIDLGRWR
jgi:penicillin-insensitive murein endopeptidase